MKKLITKMAEYGSIEINVDVVGRGPGSIIDLCEQIRKDAEKIAFTYGFRVANQTIDIEYTEVKDEDQKLLQS